MLTATVIREGNFPVGTKLTGRNSNGVFSVLRADAPPASGIPVECFANLAVENPHAVRVGDIFEMSWGYDQTNVDYFQVVRVSPAGCFVREIGARSVAGTQGFMSERVKPDAGNFLKCSSWCRTRGNAAVAQNAETFRKVHYDGKGGASFSFGRHYYASRINPNESTYSSWYA